jgi:hypothetical protein
LYDPATIKKHAQNFSVEKFQKSVLSLLDNF